EPGPAAAHDDDADLPDARPVRHDDAAADHDDDASAAGLPHADDDGSAGSGPDRWIGSRRPGSGQRNGLDAGHLG
ncbi:MAG TPA: hypothetical protein VJX10_14110, partial [Pseudonocardiaceae bacterium]|nr:hypothetical protein [Pseudonocardiaceae bacterium]